MTTNSGNRNSGDWNSGYGNSGDWNSGNRNSGDWNSGDWNSGDRNSGDWNSGDWNSGYGNSGYGNSGDWNSGNRNSGNLNTNTPNVRLFNHDSGWEFNSKKYCKLRGIIYKYQKDLCSWVYEKDMSEKEKEEYPTFKTIGGYLKVNSTTYNGKEVTREDREFLESVPNFCPKILKECTGIVFNNKKVIKIDGREIEISEESYEEFKKQFK